MAFCSSWTVVICSAPELCSKGSVSADGRDVACCCVFCRLIILHFKAWYLRKLNSIKLCASQIQGVSKYSSPCWRSSVVNSPFQPCYSHCDDQKYWSIKNYDYAKQHVLSIWKSRLHRMLHVSFYFPLPPSPTDLSHFFISPLTRWFFTSEKVFLCAAVCYSCVGRCCCCCWIVWCHASIPPWYTSIHLK